MILTGLTYYTLDRELLARIQAGNRLYHQINAGAAGEEALALQREKNIAAPRLIDARLQSLRQAGKIKHSRKTGWSLTSQQGSAQ